MTEPAKETTWRDWKEPLLAFSGLLIALGSATALTAVWAPLSGHLLAIAAIFFLGIPYFILTRKGADFERFGIDLDRIPARHILFGFVVTLVVFPLFAAGNHIWETRVLERDFEYSADHYRKWPVELEASSLRPPSDRGLQLRVAANSLHFEVTGPDEASPWILVAADRPFSWRDGNHVYATPAPPEWFDDPTLIELPPEYPRVARESSQYWFIHPASSRQSGRLSLSPAHQVDGGAVPHRLNLQLLQAPDAPTPTLLKGSRLVSTEETGHEIELKRSHWWLILWGLTHLILIALPEEYFYRGYLQTRIHDLLGTDPDNPRKILGFSRANWITSAFFALGHVLIPIGGAFVLARGAVFFPSLIFGWMRERTGSIIAPTIFHAGANMMVLIIAVHYF